MKCQPRTDYRTEKHLYVDHRLNPMSKVFDKNAIFKNTFFVKNVAFFMKHTHI